MEIRRANFGDLFEVKLVVALTIKEIYSKYYPEGVVNFFLEYHSEESIIDAFDKEVIVVAVEGNRIIATGSLYKNEIKRMFVLKEYQNRGIGKSLLEHLEYIAIEQGFNNIVLDSSLPAFVMYSKGGYLTKSYNKLETKNGDVLCYNTMEKHLCDYRKYKVNYNNKTFAAVSNTDNGEVSGKTVFSYKQEENIVWAEYFGGEIKKGFLVGITEKDGVLNFNYAHVNENGLIRTGMCKSKPEMMANNKLRLHEKWQWTSDDRSQGESVIEEV